MTQTIDQALQRTHTAWEAHLADIHTRLATLEKQGHEHPALAHPKELNESAIPLAPSATRPASPVRVRQEEPANMAANRGSSNKGDLQAMAQQIRATLQRMPDASDRQVAREVGCSRFTVARWRTRFTDDGLLQPASSRPALDVPGQATGEQQPLSI